MPTRPLRFLLALSVLGALACQNAGQDRVLGIQATGVIKGVVYLDRDGNRVLGAADTALKGVGVRVIVSGTHDTVGRGASDTAGLFRFPGIPVGNVVVAVDTTTIAGDSLHVISIDVPSLTVTPGDSFNLRVTVSYLQLTVAQARGAAAGTKVFVTGVALNPSQAFGDSTVRLRDTSGTILLTRVRFAVQTGDSVRWLATRLTLNGQPTLDSPAGFGLGTGAATPARQVSTAVAASADSGRSDAALVRVPGTHVTDTATVAGNRRLTVTDGSGPLVVELDTIAGFRGSALAADTVGGKLDLTGVLAPVGGTTWHLLPRSPSDVVPK